MDHTSTFEKVLRSLAVTLVLVFFLFPIVWIFLMSLQTNETILRIPPSLAFTPIIDNYTALVTGQLRTAVGSLPCVSVGWDMELGPQLIAGRQRNPA